MRSTLEGTGLNDADIMQIYNEGSDNIKQRLIKKFGREFFEKDWIQLFEVFCQAKGLQITYDPALKRSAGYAYLPHEKPADAEEVHENASKMIRIIIADNNRDKDFVADYKNKNQKKWLPVFIMTETGLVFSDTGYGRWNSHTHAIVGSPFVTGSSEDCERIARENLPIYAKYLVTQ